MHARRGFAMLACALLLAAGAQAAVVVRDPGASFTQLGVDLQAGDVVLAQAADGEHWQPVDTPFDLVALEFSRPPSGPTRLRVQRDGAPRELELPREVWNWRLDSTTPDAAWSAFEAARAAFAEKRWDAADAAFARAAALAGEHRIDVLAAGTIAYQTHPDRARSIRVAADYVAACRAAKVADYRLATALNLLGSAEIVARRLDEAMPHFDEALARAGGIDGRNKQVAAALQNRAFVHFSRSDLAAARHDLEAALAVIEAILPRTQAHAVILTNVASLVAESDPRAAGELSIRALAIIETLTPDDLAVARTQQNIGHYFAQRGRHAEAEPWLRRALASHRRIAPGSAEIAVALHQLAVTLAERGDSAEARRVAQEGLDAGLALAPDGFDVRRARMQVASLSNDPAQALALLDNVIATASDDDEAQLTHARAARGIALADAQRWADAIAALEPAIATYRATGRARTALVPWQLALARAQRALADEWEAAAKLRTPPQATEAAAQDPAPMRAAHEDTRDPATPHAADAERHDTAPPRTADAATHDTAPARAADAATVDPASTRASDAATLDPVSKRVAETATHDSAPLRVSDAVTRDPAQLRIAAAATLADALANARAVAPFTTQEAQVHFALARAQRADGDPRAALASYRAGIACLEAHRDLLGGNEDSRARWAARYADDYRAAIELALELGDEDAAWLLLERYRAQEFLAALGPRRDTLRERLPEPLREAWRTLEDDFVALQAAGAKAPDDAQATSAHATSEQATSAHATSAQATSAQATSAPASSAPASSAPASSAPASSAPAPNAPAVSAPASSAQASSAQSSNAPVSSAHASAAQASTAQVSAARATSSETQPSATRATSSDTQSPATLEERYAALGEQVARTEPRLHDLQPQAAIGRDAFAAGMAPNEAWLSYAILSNRVVAFVVTREDAGVVTLPIAPGDLARDIDRFGLLLASPTESADGLAALHRRGADLHAALIAPLQARIAGKTRLVIAADGALHLLPFAALVSANDDGRAHYLVEDATIVLAASATTYRRTQRDAAPAIARIGVLGAPPAQIAREDDASRGDALAALPAAAEEARHVAALFGDAAHLHLDAQATPDAALRELREADVVHFAMHAVLDARDPLASSLRLAPDAQGVDRLSAWDVMRTPGVRADLVTLSACESALGLNAGGEGLVGLSRAFQFAGVRSVVATLWRVSDRPTQRLMETFYQALRDGADRDAALAAAQRAAIAEGRSLLRPWWPRRAPIDHPYYWSAFVLAGAAR